MGDLIQITKWRSKTCSLDACSAFTFLLFTAVGLLFVLANDGSMIPVFQRFRFKTSSVLQSNCSLILGFPRLNDTARLLEQVAQNGTKQCHNMTTTHAYFSGLPRATNGSQIILSTDQVHEFYIFSYANGSKKCSGGDFYETDLSGANWKSRPPIEDRGDGSYAVKLFIDGRFEGIYRFTSILLFSNFHGLERSPEKWVQQRTVIKLEIEFRSAIKRSEKESVLDLCSGEDFRRKEWAGKWNRMKGNETCNFDRRGRSICIPLEEKCKGLWCEGAVGALESNGWVYSARCKFHIWTKDEAWQCLKNKWLFFWGDSNHQDTIRNLLNFILELNFHPVPRNLDEKITDPNNPSRSFRISSLFNGHVDASSDDWGLETIMHPVHQQTLESFFTAEECPDIAILNSDLHDGKSRQMPSNPHKMEAFNRVLREQLLNRFPDLRMVDAYDMTFPWHYDHCCSDGGHYGRPPSLDLWYGKRGHMYFVDVMLGHVLLNAICPLP